MLRSPLPPKATFNVETSQCDICEALGVKKTTTVVDTYTNGKLDTKDVTYTATATKAMVGAQGEPDRILPER